LKDFKLVLHGTYEQPDHLKNGPRIYEDEKVEKQIDTEEPIKPAVNIT
jgi:hypothetical protein